MRKPRAEIAPAPAASPWPSRSPRSARRSLRDLGTYTGTLTAKSNVIVAPKIAGRLNRLLVDIGDPVRSGQLLAVLEDDEYRQQVIQAEADLRVAKANLEEARSALTMAGQEPGAGPCPEPGRHSERRPAGPGNRRPESQQAQLFTWPRPRWPTARPGWRARGSAFRIPGSPPPGTGPAGALRRRAVRR